MNYLDELKIGLNKLKPYKAILFGSFAQDNIHEDSDIDLIVVLNNNNIPKDFNERTKNYSSVKKYFKTLNKKIAMDILVYTKAEWNQLLKLDNSFSLNYSLIKING